MENKIRMHDEIKCPFCRAGFGALKISNMAVNHIDIFWSYESGLTLDCADPGTILRNLLSIDENQNPIFNIEFGNKMTDLRDKFLSDPSDIDNTNTSIEDFKILFKECSSYGDVIDGLRDGIKWSDVDELYHAGVNLKDVLVKLSN